MKLYFEHIFLCMVIVLLTTFTSCQEEDFGFTQDEIRASVYDRNFTKSFGVIHRNQSWDLSTNEVNDSIDELYVSQLADTRAASQDQINSYFDVKKSKRYFIEDLGSTVDFDFNDIVIDVVHYEVKFIYKVELWALGWLFELLRIPTTDSFDMAYLRYLCGTTPFSVKIGDTNIAEGNIFPGENNNVSKNGPVYNPIDDTRYGDFPTGIVVNGFDWDSNNIEVTVYGTNEDVKIEDGRSVRVLFPVEGTVPRIIACNTSREPSTEGNDIVFMDLPIVLNANISLNNGTQFNLSNDDIKFFKSTIEEGRSTIVITGIVSKENWFNWKTSGTFRIFDTYNNITYYTTNVETNIANNKTVTISFDATSLLEAFNQNHPISFVLESGWNYNITSIKFVNS